MDLGAATRRLHLDEHGAVGMAGKGTVTRAQGAAVSFERRRRPAETPRAISHNGQGPSAVNVGWHHGLNPSLSGRVFFVSLERGREPQGPARAARWNKPPMRFTLTTR